MPDVVGLSRDSAESRLDDEGLGVKIVLEDSDRPEDEVIAQSPAAGTDATRGDTVTITVSRGPQQEDVPDVTGLSPGAASRTLREAGFSPQMRPRPTDSPAEDDVVVDQSPDGGGEAKKGATVVIFVGDYTPPDTNTAPVTPPADP